jgi:LPPG:FO 2-phospho-L-lactate transferase
MAPRRFILALAGGVGGGKFARGLAAVLPPDELAIIVNTADDFVHLGLHVSPDVDSVLYALADRNDPERGWGLAGETWNVMAALERLGGETWFRLGDRDLATHLLRTTELKAGRTLSEVTAALARRLGIGHAVVPMSEAAVRSIVETDQGALDFQDYFVRRQCEPKFRGVRFQGTAAPSTAFRAAIERATAIVIAPSNPYVSIDPILALEGVAGLLRGRRGPVVAVSPIVGGRAIKGPLAKMMTELGHVPSALGIARHYGSLVGGWVIDAADQELQSAIEALGCRVRICDTLMRSIDDKTRVAAEALALAAELAPETVG